ncbi:hypothetical protein BDR05DRAFT_997089 [Suillus weaverae]|nr:hypothetical protein BDR05DRAFT_997089 [Suillus weaverae]
MGTTDFANQLISFNCIVACSTHNSPTGGQGANSGVQDFFNLGWKLVLVVQGLSPFLLET